MMAMNECLDECLDTWLELHGRIRLSSEEAARRLKSYREKEAQK